MIKAILFDFDGVLTLDATGSQSICNYICNKTGVDKELFKYEYKKYNNDLLYGRTTHEEIWEKLCEEVNHDISIAILYDSFINTPINKEMFDLIKELKKKGYKIGMVTDNKKDRIDIINDYYKMDDLFDAIVVSSEIGCGKDDEGIFLSTINRLNVNAEECVFIDNQAKNLIAPRNMGLNCIYYDHEEKNVTRLVNEFRALEVEI